MKYTTYLFLQSNLGEKRENIEKAIRLLGKYITKIEQASFYETKPVYLQKQDHALEGMNVQ